MPNNTDYQFDSAKFDKLLNELENSRQQNSRIVSANDKNIRNVNTTTALGIFGFGFVLIPILFIVGVIALFGSLFLAAIFDNPFITAIPVVIVLLLFVGLIVLLVTFFKKKFTGMQRSTLENKVINTNYQTEIKEKLISEIIRSFNASFEYFPQRSIPFYRFTDMNLYSDTFLGNGYRGEDYISGKVGATNIEMCEFTIGQVSGLFLVAEFNKKFRGVTKVLTKVWKTHSVSLDLEIETEGNYGNYVKHRDVFRTLKLEPAVFENNTFNEKFDVFTSDQIEARYILSTSMMERILAFRSRYDCDMNFVFNDSNLYFTINWGANMLEPYSIHESLTASKLELIGKVHQELKYCIEIVDALSLNNELWYSR